MFSFKPIKLVLIAVAGTLPIAMPVKANSPETIKCRSDQESFGFKIRDWQIEHQGTATIDVAVKYRLKTDPNTINPDS